MLCNNCNKEIPDDSIYCPECSAPVDEPAVIKISKEDIKNTIKENNKARKIERYTVAYEMPPFNFSNYLTTLKKDASCFFALLGGVIFFYSVYFSWFWERVIDDKTKLNLFDLSSKNAENGLGNKTLLIAAILILITGIIMIIMSARKTIRVLVPHSDNMVLKILPVIMAVIILIIILTNKDYNNALNAVEKTMETIIASGGAQNYDGGRGEGIVLYGVGTLIYMASIILDKKEGI